MLARYTFSSNNTFCLAANYFDNFGKIYRVNGLELKNKGHTNFYKCYDLIKKGYLMSAKNVCVKKLKV